MIFLSHCCIIISLSCGFFVAIKLYNKASGCSIPFGKEHPLFLGYLNETAPLLLCPQKQCLSGKSDRLSGRTNQRLPPGGSSRRSRVRESALRYNQYKSKVALAPSVTASRATSLYTREAKLRAHFEYATTAGNCPHSFCSRAGVYLPPLSLHVSFVFGGSKPPPYDNLGRQNLLHGKHHFGSAFCFVDEARA